jgi:hypothetical protein
VLVAALANSSSEMLHEEKGFFAEISSQKVELHSSSGTCQKSSLKEATMLRNNLIHYGSRKKTLLLLLHLCS